MMVEKSRIRQAGWGLLGGGMLCCALLAHAAPNAPVTIKITVLAPPPCTFNNNNPITVDFEDVLTTRIDGTQYKKMTVPYNLSCTGVLSKNGLVISISGTGVNLDGGSSVLRTNRNDFGIALLRNSSRIDVNSDQSFTWPNAPLLEAVPIKRPGATLTDIGDFTATATLKLAYQ